MSAAPDPLMAAGAAIGAVLVVKELAALIWKIVDRYSSRGEGDTMEGREMAVVLDRIVTSQERLEAATARLSDAMAQTHLELREQRQIWTQLAEALNTLRDVDQQTLRAMQALVERIERGVPA